MVKTLDFHSKGCWLDPYLSHFTRHAVQPRKEKIKKFRANVGPDLFFSDLQGESPRHADLSKVQR